MKPHLHRDTGAIEGWLFDHSSETIRAGEKLLLKILELD
jgi:hypothetical protein